MSILKENREAKSVQSKDDLFCQGDKSQVGALLIIF
jgi:hypothetical protein